MINLLIAYDDNDVSLADYFEGSYNYIAGFSSQSNDITSYPMPGDECKESSVNECIAALAGQKFCFVGISHGNSDHLLTSTEAYVSVRNCYLFNQSVFYSLACHTASKLGVNLIANGCSTFVGYNNLAYATYEQFKDIYIRCETYALKEFLTTRTSLGDAFDMMIQNYTVEIKSMYDSNQILMAMELIHNRDSMNILGNKEIMQEDLHFQ